MKRILILQSLSAWMFCLSACGNILERSYTSVSVHQEQSASDEDASILRAENYTGLVSGVQHFVTVGQESGTIHVYNYSGDIASDLEAACNEVLTEDPLGAYALTDITFEYSRIVSYYECTFHYTYRRSLDQISSIVSAYSKVTLREQLEQAVSSFESTVTVRTSSYYAVASDLYAMVQDAYYSSPGTALGYPEVTISIYPDSGDIRIVELQFSYSQNAQTLIARADEVAATAALLVGQDAAADETVAWLLYSRLIDCTNYVSTGSSSIYNAICIGRANSEGVALAYQLLCDLAGISCQLVQGTKDDVPHWWNLITIDETSWMVDLTSEDTQEHFLHNDAYMTAFGYSWSQEDYPSCDGEDILANSPSPADAEPIADDALPDDEISAAESEDGESSHDAE